MSEKSKRVDLVPPEPSQTGGYPRSTYTRCARSWPRAWGRDRWSSPDSADLPVRVPLGTVFYPVSDRVRVSSSFFPRNRRGGVFFRFYAGSAASFPSFCCNPSAIRALACGIGRSRRGEAIRGVGPLIGVRSKIWFSAKDTWTAPKPAAPAPSVLRTLAVSLFFAGSHTGPRGHSVDLDEI